MWVDDDLVVAVNSGRKRDTGLEKERENVPGYLCWVSSGISRSSQVRHNLSTQGLTLTWPLMVFNSSCLCWSKRFVGSSLLYKTVSKTCPSLFVTIWHFLAITSDFEVYFFKFWLSFLFKFLSNLSLFFSHNILFSCSWSSWLPNHWMVAILLKSESCLLRLQVFIISLQMFVVKMSGKIIYKSF